MLGLFNLYRSGIKDFSTNYFIRLIEKHLFKTCLYIRGKEAKYSYGLNGKYEKKGTY